MAVIADLVVSGELPTQARLRARSVNVFNWRYALPTERKS